MPPSSQISGALANNVTGTTDLWQHPGRDLIRDHAGFTEGARLSRSMLVAAAVVAWRTNARTYSRSECPRWCGMRGAWVHVLSRAAARSLPVARCSRLRTVAGSMWSSPATWGAGSWSRNFIVKIF